ncbi:E3 ubiquitin-protein ligase BRE1A isoform X3 [Mangifera indica]|uniref:E3 ubiquitin-protein ligase BRE1A isoform X3 n=1 Tax=Mangifera indica TaxID=29780 RepID=UPI001CF959B8|nr:E3 ubiquitin-protein ligase BRE1A isoform X3 [Mangifera indica]
MMEPAKIDWNRIESVFVEDKIYENINAPKWVDLLAPDEVHVDDEAWFCRPDCKHPKTVEDFFKTPSSSKFSRSIERVPFGERNQRDARLKRRGQSQTSFPSNDMPTKFVEDCENQNPNSATPQNHVKSLKAAIKSSSEKNNKQINDTSQNDEILPRLKATLSASNLFAGRDIFNHITEFCNEMKKLATRARERENVEKKDQEGEKMAVQNENSSEVLGELDGREKERKPLLEVVDKQKSDSEMGSVKDKQRRKKRFDESENIPVSLNLENMKKKGEECLLQIRTNPPSPQCFSATRTAMRTTPSKSSAYRSMVRRILQEMEQNKEATKEGAVDKGKSVSIVEGREARALDVFWFLKPCALSG